jgi:uncharacterized protein (DUF433 family)
VLFAVKKGPFDSAGWDRYSVSTPTGGVSVSIDVVDRHIVQDVGVCGGKPRIAGRRITVEHIAVWHERLGRSVEEISATHALTMAEVHAALACYFDNRSAMDASLNADDVFVAGLRQVTPSRLQEKLRSMETAAS